jgi:hypothetical protein
LFADDDTGPSNRSPCAGTAARRRFLGRVPQVDTDALTEHRCGLRRVQRMCETRVVRNAFVRSSSSGLTPIGFDLRS